MMGFALFNPSYAASFCTRRSAARSVSALLSSASLSSAVIAGSITWLTPSRPTTLGSERHAIAAVVAADRHHRALVAHDHLGDARRDDADAELARIVAFDDRDVGVAHVLLELLAEASKILATLGEQLLDRYASDPRRRPQEDLRGAVIADHLRVEGRGVDVEVAREVHAEALAVEQRAGAQHAIVPGAGARDVGERVGRIGHDEDRGRGCGARDVRHDIAVDRGILVEQAKAALRVAAVGRAAG